MTTAPTRTPWPTDGVVITDGGLETWLMFHRGVDLPAFAAYPLAAYDAGRRLLGEYYRSYVAIARAEGAAVLLEAPTWRANPDWAATLGHDRNALAAHIVAAVEAVHQARVGWDDARPFLVGGAVGPRGDGYRVEATMDVDAAAGYHSFQIEHLAAAGVDLVSALTLGYVAEAVGIVRAAVAVGLPVVVSFTVETDGRLPSGMPLGRAIEATDDATGGAPLHYMVNCAHPTHLAAALDDGARWTARVGGLRANASTLSHAELDEMVELDDGDPIDLAARYVGLRGALPALRVLGGCCGTDDRHVAAIARAWTASHAPS